MLARIKTGNNGYSLDLDQRNFRFVGHGEALFEKDGI